MSHTPLYKPHAMMFEMSFDLQEEGALIRKVVEQALQKGWFGVPSIINMSYWENA